MDIKVIQGQDINLTLGGNVVHLALQGGLTGSDGTRWLYGAGVPAPGVGNLNDLYLNTLTKDLYSKESGSWVVVTNLTGVTLAYTHTQSNAATTWTIIHGLGFKPAVTVQDSQGGQMIGQVIHDSDIQLRILFNNATGGVAHLS